MKKTTYYIILFFLFLGTASANNIGNPYIHHFSRQDYQAATQNWAIGQDSLGRMYFANNEGLLRFDGNHWQLFPLPNKTIVRSLAIGNNGRIYVGGQDEAGYFEPDEQGQLNFHSFKDRIPEEYRNFDDVWDLALGRDQSVFFRADGRVYHWQKDQTSLAVYVLGEQSTFLGTINDIVWSHDQINGLFQFQGNEFHAVAGSADLIGKQVSAIIPESPDTYLILTLENGFFRLQGGQLSKVPTAYDAFLQKARIYKAYPLSRKRLAIGTSLSGVLIIDDDFQAQYWLSRDQGLQNNNVLSLFADQNKNLWVGTDNGIDLIETESPFSLMFPDGNLGGSFYTIQTFQNQVFLGGSNGLYKSPWQDHYNPFQAERFQLVPNSSRQIWGMNKVNETLLVGMHEGGLQYQASGLQMIQSGAGNWDFIPLKNYPGYAVAGTYEGFHLLHLRNGKWQFVQQLAGLKESSRILCTDAHGQIWMAHPYRGIYRIRFIDRPDSIAVDFFNAAHGLPADNFNHVYFIHEKILAATISGVYLFEEDTETFVPYAEINQYIPSNQWVKLLEEDPKGNIWMAIGDEVGLLQIEDQGLSKSVQHQSFPKLKDKLVKGHEFLFSPDERFTLFATETGVVQYDGDIALSERHLSPVLLSSMSILGHNDSIIWENGSTHQNLELHAEHTSLRFSFSLASFTDPEGNAFRYRLVGLDDEWSAWQSKPEKEFTNLSPGKYEFQLEGRCRKTLTQNVAKLEFEILPPWYISQTAWSIYLMVFLMIIFGLLWLPRRRFQKETEELQSALIAQEKASKAEIVSLQKERLEAEVQHQSQELGLATMHLVQKNEMLIKVRQEMEKLEKESSEANIQQRIKVLLRELDYNAQVDNDWEQFAHHFDQVHRDFFKRLSATYPQLTPNDHKLCAYLRMNLSTKEIAPLMNISIRGVEVSRYRLRKKINLDREANLTEYMMRF